MPKKLYLLSIWVCGLHERGMPLKEISHHFNITFTTIQKTVTRWNQEGEEKKGRGRHSKTSKAQDQSMVEEALKNCHNSYQDIAKKIATDVSQKTIEGRLSKKILKSRSHSRGHIWIRPWVKRGWNGHWLSWIGQRICGEGRQCGKIRWLLKDQGGEGESGYLDILKRSGIRTVLKKLLGSERETLAK